MSILSSFAVLIVWSGVAFAPDNSSSLDECRPIDSNKPSVFLSYERKGDGGPTWPRKTRRRVWLRLHNNSNCAISIETDRFYWSGVEANWTLELQENADITVGYEIQDVKHNREPQRMRIYVDEAFISHLLAGRSVTFTVPLEHFKRYKVSVPFAYDTEGSDYFMVWSRRASFPSSLH